MRAFSSTRRSCVTLPSPRRDLVLQLAGLQIVQIQLAPVVALGEPDHLVRRGQVSPVHPSVARLEVRRRPSPRGRRAPRRSPRRRRCRFSCRDRARSRRTRRAWHPGSTARRPTRRRCTRRRRRASSDADRAASGGGTIFAASTSMITRCSMATCWSPGSGYFHASSVG